MFFHAITFAGSRGSCLSTRLIGRVLKHLPRDHAMKQKCVIVILIPTKLALKTQLKHENIHFLTMNFSKQNGVGCKLSNIISSSQRHNRAQRVREHRRNEQYGPQRVLYVTSCR